jgi:hypothetical protein
MEMVNAPNVTLTGQVLFYSQPELLSRETHANLGVDASATRFGFAMNTHVCPLTVPEFGPAALSYPIIFVGEQQMPVAVMGLAEGQNLFVNEQGYEFDAYIPCYIRRYPFVLAGGGPEAEDKMLVCIDRAYEYITEGGQYKFFEGGEPTEYTKNSIQFCNDFETQNRMTQQFVKLLQDMDLLEQRSTTYTPQNPDGTTMEPQVLAQYFAVSEQKLNALSAAKLAELRDNGALSQIYAHLNSLLEWDRLLIRATVRQSQQPVAANA